MRAASAREKMLLLIMHTMSASACGVRAER